MQQDGIRVLLVEDNPGDARLVEILLGEAGGAEFAVTLADSLGAAFRVLDGKSFDVVLVDLSLPDSSGLDTVVKTRDRASETPIVVLSGQDDEQTALQALQSGAEDYLVKGRGGGEVIARSIRYSIQRKQAELRLAYLEQYDRLTGLANRALLQDRLQQALVRADREDDSLLAVMFLGLDRFKDVNSEFGHECGDAVLRTVAAQLGDRVREGNTVARAGGDEFAVIVEDLEEDHEVAYLVGGILGLFGRPFEVDGREIPVKASIGVAARPPSEGGRLLSEAEFAMSRAKSRGGNGYQFYTEEMNVQASRRLRLESSLRRALEREEFLLHYQPQVDLRSGSVFGAEALLRWRHPETGLVPPHEFIPVLEETGMITEVGEWALCAACERGRIWESRGLGPLRMAVNLSARQFEQENLAGTVERCLRQSGLDSGLLELEITESLIMGDPESSRAVLDALKSEKGLRVSVDDFGTGYSSLSYLKLFPLDALKIDRTFVRDIARDPDDAAIVEAIISLAHALGLEVIAEGVETEEQLDFLREKGCDQAQGYLFSPPVPAEDFARLLEDARPLPGFAATR